ncbi:YqzL family protein [Seinonella peptonophila]|nr:YqzL family protein [Seinonella peptonophila]
MRNFSWECFQVTGSIDAYLLYKDLEELFQCFDQDESERRAEYREGEI